MSAQHTPGPRFDVMAGTSYPLRVLQWATTEQVASHLARTNCVIVSERQIGLTLREISIAKATGSAS